MIAAWFNLMHVGRPVPYKSLITYPVPEIDEQRARAAGAATGHPDATCLDLAAEWFLLEVAIIRVRAVYRDF